jgi:thioredoxin-like negative regulator of GroEL
MKTFLNFLLLVSGLAQVARAEVPAGWSTNYAAALAEAAGDHKPALVFFTASWCGPCQMMARTTLSEPAVREVLSNYARVAIDIDEQRELAAQHEIEAVPTFVILSAGGVEVQRTTGFQAADDFVSWLTNGLAAAREAALRQAYAQKTMAEVDQLLASTNVEAPRLCAQKLFELCAVREEATVRAAAERLKGLASHTPEALLDGLGDSRLAVRVQAANALGAQLGAIFNVDAWEEPAPRAEAIAKCRAKLAAHDR